MFVIFVRYHDSAFVMLLRLIGSLLLAIPVVWIFEWARLGPMETRLVLYVGAGLWVCAEIIYRARRNADAETEREERAKSTGADPEMAGYEARAAEELRHLKDGTPIHEKPKEGDDNEFD